MKIENLSLTQRTQRKIHDDAARSFLIRVRNAIKIETGYPVSPIFATSGSLEDNILFHVMPNEQYAWSETVRSNIRHAITKNVGREERQVGTFTVLWLVGFPGSLKDTYRLWLNTASGELGVGREWIVMLVLRDK